MFRFELGGYIGGFRGGFWERCLAKFCGLFFDVLLFLVGVIRGSVRVGLSGSREEKSYCGCSCCGLYISSVREGDSDSGFVGMLDI